jgi:uncharacterized protein (DUF1800 family)
LPDDPPRAVIEEASRTFLKTNGDLREVVRTILMSPQFRSADAVRAKIKKPFELVASAFRAVDATFEDLDAYAGVVAGNRNIVSRMGEKLYNHEAPDGNPDVGPAWMNSNALLIRLDFANRLATDKFVGVKSNIASAERLLGQLGIPRPTPAQIAQTQAMVQSAEAASPPSMAVATQQSPMMMGATQGAAAASKPADPVALAVAAMLGSPQFQKR